MDYDHVNDLRVHEPPRWNPNSKGEFVLYWIQTTHRVADNFALEYAIRQANRLARPLIVYQEISALYPWASDRFLTFALEGCLDLAESLESLGIPYLPYVNRGPRSSASNSPTFLIASPLTALAQRASLVVTDWFPDSTATQATNELGRKVGTPVVSVESCTIVPSRVLSQEFNSARGIRPRLEAAFPHFLHHAEIRPPSHSTMRISLSFDPVALKPAGSSHPNAIDRIVASLPIDHTIKPSQMLRGGYSAAQERLTWFTEKGLLRYGIDRSDPQKDGTSRLSAYLRFGHISPHQVLLACRDKAPPESIRKFQDQLLVWRELAYNLATWNPSHRTVDAIPSWARRELQQHEGDPRPQLYSLEALSDGATESELWNACQRRLVRDGELHNALRMLWGKAVIGWSKDASQAFAILVELNNRFALDGGDPNSYAGILWCFGKFDRPFFRRSIFGTVRYMSLRAGERRFRTGGALFE